MQVLSIFTEYFESPLATSITGKAIEKGLFAVEPVDIRAFATDKHKTTDDVPFGGGAGMVMKPEPLVAALEFAHARQPDALRILLTPQGEPFHQALARELSQAPGLILVCGRYEGVDERVIDGWIDREISIGDYVLTGGEPAALILIDAITRLLPGVLGNVCSIDEESFSKPSLEYPHYTRPREFRGRSVPDVLLSGNHKLIADWRRAQSEKRTRERRPDLLDNHRDSND
ncbi:MAG: tRNA (guanosine(37)-N1)-methyltransferase TrmD [Bradymonadaceae bacterium]|nr:tRNA (guanosine(37)-N1)-methyltransferase TrmD [Lujinxingiaceae bacterium]